ncbi:hypothetical protein BB31_06200 [Amycolatopsis lurida NRRL 2430]|uniref:AMP-binding enzyme C-terminal domain-containing protein n=1 Tax=Amycolatopsis lurida NRRL 2430 TaxID=1460371 RepID=A0A2P2FYX0_AMYLU|nr:hypothetical protein BB31_06200 [Amycolatopsis lurida NRRL 2430]
MACEAVQDCAVIGLPHEKWGEQITAVVQLHTGKTVSAHELRTAVKERLGSIKTPKEILLWPDLPRSKIGKVLKTEIRKALLDNG